jgi:hypothetical protein
MALRPDLSHVRREIVSFAKLTKLSQALLRVCKGTAWAGEVHSLFNLREYGPPQDGFADANLIQLDSRIKRASRHVPLIRIFD